MKNRFFSTAMMCILGLSAWAQSSARSASIPVHIVKQIVPPQLEIIQESIRFVDPNNNGIIDAQEKCAVQFKVKNMGKGEGYGCVAKIAAMGSVAGITYANQNLSVIASGEVRTISMPISSSMNTVDGKANFTIFVDEPNGFGTNPIEMSIQTHRFDAPLIEIVSTKIISGDDDQLRKKDKFKLQILLQNTDQGVARNVTCKLQMPQNMYLIEGEPILTFPEMQPNQKEEIVYELQSSANIADQVSLSFLLSESYGKYAKNKNISLSFNQAATGAMALNIQGHSKEKVEITKGSLVSDVDENIPVTSEINFNTYAVIIANENYFNVATVPYALNDGKIFREYCQKTLGLTAKHIHYVPNATLNQIKTEVDWLRNMVEASDNPKVIFYYAGHGIPDESSRTSYLLPIDGLGNDISTGYRLDDLYATLGGMNSDAVTVFMDACFSGSKREQGMLASARGVALKAKAGAPQGNMVVFSAAQGDETAYPYVAQKHGLFTYYLLKKLQETKGDITYDELSNYIYKNVRYSAVEENGKPQTPTITASSMLGESWKNWKLK